MEKKIIHPGKYELVLIGGSAGSLDALHKILPYLPAGFSMTVVIVVHRMAIKNSPLSAVLQHISKLEVKEAEEKEKIRAGIIYLAPADQHLLIEDDKTFSLNHSGKINFCRPSIDVTFKTAANVYKEKCIGVILTGSNTDGASGLWNVKQNKGLTFVEDPETAQLKTMPEAAIRKTSPDFILDLQSMVQELLKLAGTG